MDPSDLKPSALTARGDPREYNVYVETGRVEKAWPVIPDWFLSPQLGPLLVSLEIALKILDGALDESGTRPYLNDAAKAEVVAASVCSLLNLVADIAFENRSPADPPDILFGPPSRESAWSQVMEKLERLGNRDRLRGELGSHYGLAGVALGFDLGLGRPSGGTRCLDYDRWVRPTAIHALYTPDRRQRYVEDPIFVRVHQVCEGILEAMLAELERMEVALFRADYLGAERHALLASHFERPFERTIHILGEMSQHDYAPLRVALRDASGIQSARAQARKTMVKDQFWLFHNQLKHHGLDCLVVLTDHQEHIPEYRLLQGFKFLAQSIQETMSNHAHMVQNVLGSTVIGTAGFRILSLGEIAALPLLPELAKSLDKLTLWTNLRYAEHSGIVIQEQETQYGVAGKYEYSLPTEPCERALMRKTADRYFAAIQAHDKDEWRSLFVEHPHFEDPKGTKPYISEWNLDVFFRNFQKLFPKVLEAGKTIVEQGDNHLKVAWRISAESFLDGLEANFSGTETFYFNPEGQIAVAFAEWQPAALAEDLLERHRASLRNPAR